MRILVTGSRDWEQRAELERALLDARLDSSLISDDPPTLVSGACPTGADRMAEEFAASAGWTVERHPADWKTHGRKAGPIRNREMVNAGADLCLAFIRNGSRGATMTADLAERAGIKVLRYFHEEDTNAGWMRVE